MVMLPSRPMSKWRPNMALQRTRRPSLCSGRSLRSLGSPLNARPLGGTRFATLFLVSAFAAFSGGHSLAQELTPQPRFVNVRVLTVQTSSCGVGGEETLPGVEILATQIGPPATRGRAVTNARGEARIGPLSPGSYVITARLSMFRPHYSGLVTVGDEPTHLVLLMSLAAQPTCGPLAIEESPPHGVVVKPIDVLRPLPIHRSVSAVVSSVRLE